MRSSLQSELATNSKSRHAMKKFSDLTELEVLAVAIASEEEDGRIYMSFAENLAERYSDSARIFEHPGDRGADSFGADLQRARGFRLLLRCRFAELCRQSQFQRRRFFVGCGRRWGIHQLLP
jgi:hypothetical protein